jgi:hypothetical protein
LKAAARQRRTAGQGVLDLGLDTGAPGGPLPAPNRTVTRRLRAFATDAWRQQSRSRPLACRLGMSSDHVITAANPLPGELRQAIDAINAG